MIQSISELTVNELIKYWNELYNLNKVDYCIYINSQEELLNCNITVELLITAIERYSYYIFDKYFYIKDNVVYSFSRLSLEESKLLLDYINNAE
jgi:hypothetical protein